MKTKIISLLVMLNLFQHLTVIAQLKGQPLLDSLLTQLPQAIEDTNKVKLLNELSYNYPYINPDEGLKYGKQGLELATNLSWIPGIAAANYSIGGNYANKADYANALKYEYESLKMYEQLKDDSKQAILLQNIGVVYHTSKNQTKALEYDNKALELYEKLNNKEGIAAMYSNVANVYYSLKDKDKVLENNLKSLHLYEELNNKEGVARLLGNIANFYAEEGDYGKAMAYYFNALRRETELGNKNGVTRNMGNIGETYLDIATDTTGKIKPDSIIKSSRTANLEKALEYLNTTLKNANELKQTEYILGFSEVLSDAYRLSGNTKEALNIYKDYIAMRDSVYDVEKYNAATRRQLDYEYGKREDSIKFQKKLTDVKLVEEKKSRSREKAFYIAGLILVLVFSGFMFNRWRVTQQQKKIIEEEKKRSDQLLLNILPAETAEELKNTGKAEAKDFDQVTVMFTDFKNFTQASEMMSAKELVREINFCYSEFDKIISNHGIEKIKTIGDSYMCAGGLPVTTKTNGEDTVRAALEICDFMLNEKQKRIDAGLPYFDIRIGCNSGAVVAGIVGLKKFAYDIWGDTVNIASRMESSGEIGKVNISGSTYELVKDKFNCTYRGKIEAKNKGMIDMYFVGEMKLLSLPSKDEYF
ncbi:MAG: adenylate/guanylate cyclase domain-containing protein [Bacteroidia bacterium]